MNEHKPWRKPVAFLLCSSLVAYGLACTTQLSTVPVVSKPGTTTTIILVRNAERNEGFDPPLNAEGRIRAEVLLDVLGQNGVTAVYCRALQRNIQTAQPLADLLGLELNVISELSLIDTKAFANQFVDEVLEFHAGGVVLLIGNIGPVTDTQSGNLQEVYARLGGTGEPPVRYQDLYTAVVTEAGDVNFIEAAYGVPSTLD